MHRNGQPNSCNIQHLGDIVKQNDDHSQPDPPITYKLRPWGREDQLSLALPAMEPHLYLSEARSGYGSILYYAYTRRDGSRVPARKNFPLTALSETLQICRGISDCYIALAEFYKPEPRIAYIARIGANWLDLDSYNVPDLADRSHDQIIYHILDRCADVQIPRPSLIMSSGRGYYLKWIYNKPLTQRALERWSAVQHALHDQFKSLASDRASLDAAHVLRIEHTVNSKCGKPAEIVWEYRDPKGELVRYDFEYLAYEILPYSRQELQELQAEREATRAAYELQRSQRTKSRKHTNLVAKTINDLSYARLCDLRQLFGPQMRGIAKEGERDTVFFMALCFCCETLTFGAKEEEIAAIWQEFAPSLKWREAKGYAGSAIGRWKMAKAGKRIKWRGRLIKPTYRWQNGTIIKWLGITSEEQRQMTTLIGPEERKRRELERYTARRRTKGQITRVEYESNAARKRIEIEQRLAQGLKPSVIAQELGIDVSGIYKIWKKWKVRPVI